MTAELQGPIVLRFAGGDGDPDYTDHTFDAMLLTGEGSQGYTAFGKSFLVKVLSGRHEGRILAITSRTNISITQQIKSQRYVSTILISPAELDTSSQSFWESTNFDAVGMIAAEILN